PSANFRRWMATRLGTSCSANTTSRPSAANTGDSLRLPSYVNRSEELMDAPPPFEHFQPGAGLGIDAGQVQHSGPDHGRRHRLPGRGPAPRGALSPPARAAEA